ncbi:MAG: HAMP domain-containing sensor histidine kinase [Bacteroidota bacterium]
MNNKRLALITVLISVVVTGLILIQLYWIDNAIGIKEEHFEQTVTQALNEVVHRIEKKSTAAKITKRLNFQRQSIKPNAPDSTALLPAIANNKAITPSNYRLNVYEETISDSAGVVVKKSRFKQFFNDTLSQKSLALGSTIDQLKPIATQQVDSLKKTDDWFSHREDIMNEIFDELISVNIYNDVNAAIDTAGLKKMIQEELMARGVMARFVFGIVINNKTNFEFIEDPELKNELVSSRFFTNLSPDNIFVQPRYLSVYFPHETRYIIKTMRFVLIGSSLMILILIATFYFTLSTIYRQKKLSEIKNDFINNMTHELKTPISTISLATEVLSDESVIKTPEKTARYLRVINEENKRLSVLVENVLQTAILDKGQLKLNLTEQDLHVILQQAVNNIRLQVEKNGGEIICEFNAVQHEHFVDKTHITNIIYNLIDNALKYSDKQPLIKVVTLNVESGIFIKIIDNGIGISKENQKKVFEKLYRIPTGNVHNVKGYGLGLSYVKVIVEKHGGTISIDSELGQGSTFSIYLPYNNNLK